jgi:hypothetical protein
LFGRDRSDLMIRNDIARTHDHGSAPRRIGHSVRLGRRGADQALILAMPFGMPASAMK